MSTAAKKAAALDQSLRAELQALKQIQQGKQLVGACDVFEMAPRAILWNCPLK